MPLRTPLPGRRHTQPTLLQLLRDAYVLGEITLQQYEAGLDDVLRGRWPKWMPPRDPGIRTRL